jgi:hypothetical protein
LLLVFLAARMCFNNPLPSNGRLLWLHYSGFRCHVTVLPSCICEGLWMASLIKIFVPKPYMHSSCIHCALHALRISFSWLNHSYNVWLGVVVWYWFVVFCCYVYYSITTSSISSYRSHLYCEHVISIHAIAVSNVEQRGRLFGPVTEGDGGLVTETNWNGRCSAKRQERVALWIGRNCDEMFIKNRK